MVSCFVDNKVSDFNLLRERRYFVTTPVPLAVQTRHLKVALKAVLQDGDPGWWRLSWPHTHETLKMRRGLEVEDTFSGDSPLESLVENAECHYVEAAGVDVVAPRQRATVGLWEGWRSNSAHALHLRTAMFKKGGFS